jgi:hypothetical protein
MVALVSTEGSAPDGEVTLVSEGADATRVEVRLGTPNVGIMPAHIHEGTCGATTPQPRFPLEGVANGLSSTRVAIALEELRALPHTVNVHLSKDRLEVVVACANLATVTAEASGPAPVDDGAHAGHADASQK